MVVVVRAPAPVDVARIARINVETWRAAYDGIVPSAYLDGLDIAKFEERWLDRVSTEQPGISILVAEVDDALSSYVVVGPYRTQEDADPDEDMSGWAEFYAIYTDPVLQGRGAGRAVHDAAIALLRDEGYERVALWVLTENTASRRWYAARGWRADGATSTWDGAGTPLEEIRMTLDLTSG
jgi:GNAT superfamily N-acetyltransferase